MASSDPKPSSNSAKNPDTASVTQNGQAGKIVDNQPVGQHDSNVDIVEKPAKSAGAGPAAIVLLASLALFVGSIISLIATEDNSQATPAMVILGIGGIVVSVLALTTLRIVQPGQTNVQQFFGRYIGTIRRDGLSLVPPLTSAKKVSIKINNFETNELKVNDLDGNPVNIAAIVVWQVKDTARAVFAVEDYKTFIRTQAEAALRHVATSHPYDEAGPGKTSLRGGTDIVSAELAKEVAERVAAAGLEIIEVRISSLAYAPEIAQAMLQRQQAGAVIAAREQIVEGAVSMVDQALSRLEAESIVTFDDERKAQMVSNLLVVLCSDQRTTPVVNTGSLYA